MDVITLLEKNGRENPLEFLGDGAHEHLTATPWHPLYDQRELEQQDVLDGPSRKGEQRRLWV